MNGQADNALHFRCHFKIECNPFFTERQDHPQNGVDDFENNSALKTSSKECPILLS
jgi:hypothetical protein